eukprot:jgi/Mesvir1/24885/Mv26016-RA.1
MESLPPESLLKVLIFSSDEEAPGCIQVSKDVLRLASPVFQRMLSPEQAMKEKDGVLKLRDCSVAAFQAFIDAINPGQASPVDWYDTQPGLLHDVVKIAVKYDVKRVIESIYHELAAPRVASKIFEYVSRKWAVDTLSRKGDALGIAPLERSQSEARRNGRMEDGVFGSRLVQAVSEFDLALVGSSYDEPGRFRWPPHVEEDVITHALLRIQRKSDHGGSFHVGFQMATFSMFREQTVNGIMESLEFVVPANASNQFEPFFVMNVCK